MKTVVELIEEEAVEEFISPVDGNITVPMSVITIYIRTYGQTIQLYL